MFRAPVKCGTSTQPQLQQPRRRPQAGPSGHLTVLVGVAAVHARHPRCQSPLVKTIEMLLQRVWYEPRWVNQSLDPSRRSSARGTAKNRDLNLPQA